MIQIGDRQGGGGKLMTLASEGSLVMTGVCSLTEAIIYSVCLAEFIFVCFCPFVLISQF